MRLSSLLSHGMVLQRGLNTRVWGTTQAGRPVTVRFLGQEYRAVADEAGKWEIPLGNLEPGGPYEMELRAGESTVIRDILIGDVWLLGGQSNMELPVRRTLDLFAEEVRDVRESGIRMFAVPQQYDFHGPRDEIESGRWVSVTPADVLDFSAAGYFFARELHGRYGIPIGLIQTAVGGTPAEAWISEATLRELGGYEEELARCGDDAYVRGTMVAEAQRNENWHRELAEKDAGLKGTPWYAETVDVSGWREIQVPGLWDGTALGDFKGSVWLRKEFEIPEDWPAAEARLVLGTLVDADETYVNGVKVGSTGYKYPPRRYAIPPGTLHAGKNSIAVRLVVCQSTGGFVPDKPYRLLLDGRAVDLAGMWRYRIGGAAEPLAPMTFFQYKPAGVYNGMLHPLRRYAIKGVAFYQGESNTGNPAAYERVFTALIQDWRRLFGLGDLPFLYVQLANFTDGEKSRTSCRWAELREGQRRALKLANTAMAVTIDVGEHNDLHPQDKKTVGQRLALCARKLAYGEDGLVYSGPLFERKESRGRELWLYFSQTGGGLAARGGELKGFTICGEDGVFVPAKAAIAGDAVVVSAEEVPFPRHARYAWTDNPAEANLYNREGLPASPFTTED